ncbi:DUF3383 family protein [Dyadobacter psychrotolerans]|uniref:DUF3383 family protein n=1 Tax=Dyadobacter psychrotolerans TaxID=2541721 RepID=A0A4R5DYB3_9BACT|nr:DUF3383 family protein [Dyadobacter psychrotolerans]TDE17714.1 DUF3383 family protein [Dyadobacter psychrotolerans]
MAGEIPVQNIINVSITNTPSGLTEKNVNSLALFTTEQPANPGTFGSYGIYINPSQVATDFGTASVTAQMANAVFAQSPNLRTGNGRLVILPLLASVSATAGKFTTTAINANIANFAAVSNGDVRVTINTIAYNLLGMNFTGVQTLADIAAVIQAKLPFGIVTAVGNTLVFSSKKVGTTSTVALAAATGGTGTSLITATYLNSTAGAALAGVNASGETITAAIARTSGSVAYVGVMSNLDLEDAVITANATAIQAMDRMYFQHGGSQEDISGIALSVKNAGLDKTRILVYAQGAAQANLMKAAYAGRALSVNFTGSQTAQTMHLKQLATIVPDTNITQTLYDAAEISGADIYVSIDGVPCVISNGGNDFFDNVYADLALKFALETAGFNYLRQTNTKVPQTEPGMNGLKNAYSQVVERFVRNGSIAPGSWTSSERFGDPEIFDENVLNRGYYVYSLPITQQSAPEREARKAPLVQIAVKRAGAIHTSDVIVNINN